jgi:ketosteroid isomerase-like protein
MIKHFFLASALSIILFACGDTIKQTATNADSPELAQYKKDQRNKAIALQCIRAYQARDSVFILAHNADNVVNIYAGQPPIYGIDSCRIILRQAFNMTKEYKPSNELALADSNYVFVFLYVDISFRESPEAYHAKSVEMYKFNDEGKIILHTVVNEELEPNVIKRSL